MSINITIGKAPRAAANLVIVNSKYKLTYASIFCFSSTLKLIQKELKHKNEIYACSMYLNTEPKKYKMFTSTVPDSDYQHAIIYRQDEVYKDDSGLDWMDAYVFVQDNVDLKTDEDYQVPDSLIDAVYDKFEALAPYLVLREWIPDILKYLLRTNYIYGCTNYSGNNDGKYDTITCYTIHCPLDAPRMFISSQLRDHKFSINGTNSVSPTMEAIESMDPYLNTFNVQLAEQIRDSFRPYFTPGKDTYDNDLVDLSDYSSYSGRLNLYPAQLSVIQACSNALDKDKCVFLIGEQGSGKTAISTEIALLNNKDKPGMTNIVLCPGHLVNKWKREIERIAPNSDAVIVNSFDDLIAIKPVILNKFRKRHLWVIISKDRAKLGYEERPAAVWNEHKKCFVCPDCGKPLYTIHYEGRGRARHAVYHFLDKSDFAKKGAENTFCCNTIPTYNHKTGEYEDKPCHASLWQANAAIDEDGNKGKHDWVQLGKQGWMMRSHIEKTYNQLINKENLSKKEEALLSACADVICGNEPIQREYRRYPIAKYILKYMKGKIDYLIADELHLYKGNSLQGESFGDLVAASKHVIGATGTLLNGYASGVYYLLYRMFPSLMKEEGYEYGVSGENLFIQDYGVLKKEQSFEWHNGRQGDSMHKSKIKELPGVSPLVFTKFLLERAVFIGIEDISDGLPGYVEIPVSVEMDDELRRNYMDLAGAMRLAYNGFGMKTMSQMMNLLSVYPDTPYGQYPVIHPDTGEVIAAPADLPNIIRNKERRFLELVQEKVSNGEKVLVYYNWVDKSDLGKKLPALLNDNGIKSAVLTSSVSGEKREAWIQDKLDKGIDVLICNPSLVETGLDLLDFTTIIFYQMGYNLYTMRQASRRSWRLSQTKDVKVYFLYYKDTVQENAISLMATKLQAAMAIEGKFSEDGLNAMSNNEDILTQIASSVVSGIQDTIDAEVFEKITKAGGNGGSRKQKYAERLIDKPKTINTYSVYNYKPNKKHGKIVKKSEPLMSIADRSVLHHPMTIFNYI